MFRRNTMEAAREFLQGADSDDILDSLGLMRRSTAATAWVLPTVIGVGAGVLVGIGIGMAVAPKKGSELRHDIGDKIRRRDYEGIAREARELAHEARGGAGRVM